MGRGTEMRQKVNECEGKWFNLRERARRGVVGSEWWLHAFYHRLPLNMLSFSYYRGCVGQRNRQRDGLNHDKRLPSCPDRH